jgi:sortase (surface protein transpeptidase)
VTLSSLDLMKKVKTKAANLMILMGVLVLSLSVNNTWRQYRINHSEIDQVDISPLRLDSNNILPYSTQISPTRTPFQPVTPTPFQPQEDQKASITSRTGINAGKTAFTPEAAAKKPVDASASRAGFVPDRLVIPAIHLDTPIIPIHYKTIEYYDQTLEQWLVPNTFAAGWHDTSALLGMAGNTVLNGHHNAYGQVFKDVINLEPENTIEVYSGDKVFTYLVAAKMLFPERFHPIEERIANARWILPSDDERLTIITCWPADSNTGRVVIVAFPLKQ